ncbi:cytochrome c oxidase assembly protein subunit 23, partial [Tremellales sp. Uapishka_1]
MATQVPPSKNPTPNQNRPAPPGIELETPADYKAAFQGRSAPSKHTDPCEAASKASLDCLERSHYNREECFEFFKAYRECKAKWVSRKPSQGGKVLIQNSCNNAVMIEGLGIGSLLNDADEDARTVTVSSASPLGSALYHMTKMQSLRGTGAGSRVSLSLCF